MERLPDEASSGMSHGREAKHLPVVAVGVDGSAGSREALQWAIAEARVREVPLRAIHAWTYAQPLIPSLIGYPYSAEYVDSTNDERQQAAERLLEHVTATLASAGRDAQTLLRFARRAIDERNLLVALRVRDVRTSDRKSVV